MKKAVLFLFFILVSLNGYTQKISKNEVDKFNGNRIMQTNVTNIGGNTAGNVYFSSVNNAPLLHYACYGGTKFRISTTAKLLLLDEQDNVYTFTLVAGGYNDYFPFLGDYEKLIGKNIVEVRLEYGRERHDQKVKKNRYQAFSQQYLCIKNAILQHFPKGVLLSTEEGVKEIME